MIRPLWLFALLLLLTACTPAVHPNQGQAISQNGITAITRTPRPAEIQPDAKGTNAALELQQAIVQATQQAAAISATQAGATSIAQAHAEATSGASTAWAMQVQGWTATAGAVQATQTEAVRGTATKAYAPFAGATVDALRRKEAIDVTKDETTRRLVMPTRVAGILVLYGIPLLFASAFVIAAVYYGKAHLEQVRLEYGPALLEKEQPAVPLAPRTQLAIYTGEPGAVSAAKYADLPCSTTDMLRVAYWVVVREDTSLAVNKWEKRELSGPIDRVRDWFVEHGYADQDVNNFVEVNAEGVAFLTALRGHAGNGSPYPTDWSAANATR